jgi:O-acetylserine/cysteine efflux transporter
MLTLRFIGLCLVLAPVALRQKRPPMRQMLFLSVTLQTVQFGLMFTALHLGLSITSAVIATQLGVPFSCLMAAIFFKDYLGPWRSFGLLVAFLGVVIVAGTPDASAHWMAFLLMVGGCMAWSVANLYLKTIDAPHSMSLLFWPALLSLPQFMLLSALLESDQLTLIAQAHRAAWLGVAYSTLISSIIGYGLWNWLITHFPVSRVMPFGLLMPVFGIFFGSVLFGEMPSERLLLGGALTMVGVAIITFRRPKLAETEH